jgi:5-formyltetrahydrofolate cyclo-ligase
MHPQQIRQHYRRLRKNLSYSEQKFNAQLLAENINLYLGNYKHHRVAAYLDVQGEISLSNWIESQCMHRIYLPKLYEPIQPELRFAYLSNETQWVKNRFNIVEPKAHWGETLHSRELDIILMPLVAFDRSGNRMGMGAGYYDRSLAFKRTRHHYCKPTLIGVAHSIQEHPQLISNKWDVSMDCIITEKEVIQPAQ